GRGWATTELYAPGPNAGTPAASMSSGRVGHTATLPPNCQVLIVGDTPQAVLYDTRSGTFIAGPAEPGGQTSYHTATLLADGRVLIAGGVDGPGAPVASAIVYDPATNAFTSAGSLSEARSQALAGRPADRPVPCAGG